MRKASVCIASLLVSSQLLPGAIGYLQHNLVADTPGIADFTDPNLVNAWGLVASAAGPFWVCDGGTNLSTVYTTSGTPNPNVKPAIPSGAGAITASGPPPALCTGIVSNSAATSFIISNGRPASFIFASEEGSISAWANAVDPAHAVLKVDNSSSGAVYKGLAISTSPTPLLFAANFHAGTIDVFDANFAPVSMPGAFSDSGVPAGFAPFNIWNLGGKLYVTYALQDSNRRFDVPGNSNGFVAVFDTSGRLLQHLISGGPLNSPWGLAIAPATFGKFANDLLVGNFGDGTIDAFDPTTGVFLGALQDPSGKTITIQGLWALFFGNGGNGGDKDALYFTAGPGALKHGLLGSIQANPNVAPGAIGNAAQSTAGMAANSFMSIFGTNLSPVTRAWRTSDFIANKLPTSLEGVSVTVNGQPAFVAFVSPKQINVLMPADLAANGQVEVQTSNNGLTSAVITSQAQLLAPAFFLFNSDKFIAALHSDNTSLIGPTTLFPNKSTPAKPGETIVLFGSGFGPTITAVANGQVVLPGADLPLAGTPVISFNGLSARVLFAGLNASGLYQFNVVVPAGLPNGDVPVRAEFGGFTSPGGAFITVQNQ